jgi:hypothetical protein
MNQPMQAVVESEVFWHLRCARIHLEKLLDAATHAGFEVTIPIRRLDLLNDVTENRGRCAGPLSPLRWRIDRTFGGQNWLHVRHGCKRSVSLRLFAKF